MVDILIPVYNGFDDLQLCVQSVEKYTDLTGNRVIFVDDHSPDQRVVPFLRRWTEEHPGTVLYENEKNYGFSHNVNIGFSQSETNDVLLLNTDTIVTKDWLEKLSRCANTDEMVGTVCPLSNNATLCSVPKFMENNELPQGWTVDDMGTLVEECSLHRYPEIPVSVGFCMYIPRRVIKQVGNFDEETFQRGYGEEDDFCYRAHHYGYRHLLCDDTYVFHTGKASFLLEESEKLTNEHVKINVQRYPEQTSETVRFVQEQRIRDISENVQRHVMSRLLEQSGRKTVLFVSHACFAPDAQNRSGGIQTHMRDLIAASKDELNVLVTAREENMLRVGVYCGDEKMTLYYPIYPQLGITRHHDTQLYNAYEDILLRFKVQAVHVHQVLWLSFDIFDLAKKYVIPTYLTLHDYYLLCPNFKLLDGSGRVCDGCCDDPNFCAECLKQSEVPVRTKGGYVKEWQALCHDVIRDCEKVFAPSECAKRVFATVYPDLADKMLVIPHGIVGPKEAQPWCESALGTEGYIVKSCVDELFFSEKGVAEIRGWAYIEGLNSKLTRAAIEVSSKDETKIYPVELYARPDLSPYGSQYTNAGFSLKFSCWNINSAVKICILLKNVGRMFVSQTYKLKAVKQTGKLKLVFVGGLSPAKGSRKILELIKRVPSEVSVWLIGDIGDPELKNLQRPNVYRWGHYEQEEIFDILRCIQPDLTGIFSVWNETFCYTLSETVACGIPAMVTNLGAPADRVKEAGYGWVLDQQDPVQDAVNLLERLCKDPSELQRKKYYAEKYRTMTIREMASQYLAAYNYREDVCTLPEPDEKNCPMMYLPNKADNARSREEIAELNDKVRLLQVELHGIHSARSYRMLVRMNELRRLFLWPLRKLKSLLRR